jgi:hypothetical protein
MREPVNADILIRIKSNQLSFLSFLEHPFSLKAQLNRQVEEYLQKPSDYSLVRSAIARSPKAARSII